MCLNTLLFRILGFVSMSTILVSHHPEIHSRVFSWRQLFAFIVIVQMSSTTVSVIQVILTVAL